MTGRLGRDGQQLFLALGKEHHCDVSTLVHIHTFTRRQIWSLSLMGRKDLFLSFLIKSGDVQDGARLKP